MEMAFILNFQLEGNLIAVVETYPALYNGALCQRTKVQGPTEPIVGYEAKAWFLSASGCRSTLFHSATALAQT